MSGWQALANGKVAIIIDGSWALQDIAKLDFNYGCAVLPVFQEPATVLLAHSHCISSTTEHPDEAWKLLAYLSSNDYQLGLIKVGLWLPSHTSLLTPDGIASWMTEGVHPEGYDLIVTDYVKNYGHNLFYPAGYAEANALITPRSIRCGSAIKPRKKRLWPRAHSRRSARTCRNSRR